MSLERGNYKTLELPSNEGSAISTSEPSTSISSRLPQEIIDLIQDFVNEGQGQLRHDYRSPAFMLAIKLDREPYARALRHYLRTNAHITSQNEESFLSKPKEEIERLKNLHITWFERLTGDPRVNFFTFSPRPDVRANIQSLIIDFDHRVPGQINFILKLVCQLPKLRRLGIRICAANEYNGSKKSYDGRIEWSLSQTYERLGFVAKREERDAPDGAQLWFWEAVEGKVLEVEEIMEV